MDERIREAFDSVQASEGLKARTRARIASELAARHRPVWRRRMAAVAVCLCLLVACIGGAAAYFTPTASITFEGESSIAMAVNRFQRVLWVEGKNEAGCALADSLSVRFLPYTEAVEQVLANAQLSQTLSQEDGLSITVIGDDEAARTEMLTQVRACAAGQNVYCAATDEETAAQAAALGLPLGKYRVYEQLLAAGDSLTAEQAGQMTMRQLRDRLAALTGQTDDEGQGGYGYGGGNGSGQGPAGGGNGRGQGGAGQGYGRN